AGRGGDPPPVRAPHLREEPAPLSRRVRSPEARGGLRPGRLAPDPARRRQARGGEEAARRLSRPVEAARGALREAGDPAALRRDAPARRGARPHPGRGRDTQDGGGAVGEGRFLDPGIGDGERSTYRGLIGGEPAGEGTATIRAVGGDEPRYRLELSMTVRGEAVYEGQFEALRRRGHLIADHYRLETRHGERAVAVEEGWFRDVAVLGWGGEVGRYPSDVAPLLGCAVMLRGLEFERGAERSFAVWLTNTVYWEVALKVERRERVSLPAGALDAWRVRARPSFHMIGAALDRIVG